MDLWPRVLEKFKRKCWFHQDNFSLSSSQLCFLFDFLCVFFFFVIPFWVMLSPYGGEMAAVALACTL